MEAINEHLHALIEYLKNFWHNFDIKKWSESIGGSSAEAVQTAIYFVLSFALGFLFKKYFKLIFVCFIVTLFSIKAMEVAKLIIIDWQAIKTLFGITSEADFNAILNTFFIWIKHNLLLFISCVIGFLVGYKLG
jgi:uncharacterized membrane protein (Fun14 family)